MDYDPMMGEWELHVDASIEMAGKHSAAT